VSATTGPITAFLTTPEGYRVPLVDGLTIGRKREAGLRLDDVTVSRDHALIVRSGSRWLIRDCGSRNGTRVNGTRLPAFADHTLRDRDRVAVGAVVLHMSMTADDDRDATVTLQVANIAAALSPYQHRVISALAQPWLRGGEPATNADIAAALGTPDAVEAVKAALRRCYVKFDLADLPTHTKRRELCRRSQESGLL
jgi:O6-methylguanine-DNA--protein-cysteine methyltransferase